jgi:ACS family hexuronate transporter-like MFS transporter
LFFRVLLGFAEAANWPCALRTTQRILPPGERAMGNSILQSGAAVGAIIIPIVLLVLFDDRNPTTWRLPFLVVGAAGTVWVLFWWASVRPADLALQKATGDVTLASVGPRLPRDVFIRRFIVLVALVTSINMTWHFLRAWLPSYLMKEHAFSQTEVNWFSSAYYVFTDLGALTAGFVALHLARGGMAVHASRRLVFLCGALLTTLCLAVPFVSHPVLLVGLLLVIGFGSLGVFPCYYSFSQDLTTQHQGKLTGTLGACCWVTMFFWQIGIGATVEFTGSYTLPFLISGIMPLLAFGVLMLLWGPTDEKKVIVPVSDVPAEARAGADREDQRITVNVEAVKT